MKYLEQELDLFYELGDQFKLNQPQIQSQNELNGKYIKINDKEVIDFTRLDYLALGNEKKIKALMQENIVKHDISCPASQMILKPDSLEKLELELAQWHGLEHSILYSNGYSANVNAMQALGLRWKSPHILAYSRFLNTTNVLENAPTVFVIDKDSHYSLIHGVRIACKFSDSCVSYMYDGRDEKSLLNRLAQVEQKYGDDAVKIIVTDSLVSSTGNYINLKYIYDLAVKYDYLLYVDEAHAVGAVGDSGAGVFHDQVGDDFEKERVIIMGTLTKTFSQLGGYVSFGSSRLAMFVKTMSPQYVFSAPVLPWMAQTLRQTLTLFKGGWGKQRREVLHTNAKYLRDKLNDKGFNTLNSQSFIVPVFIGDEVNCLQIGDQLLEYGYNVACFRFPAVAKGEAILRVSVCADITKEEIDGLVNAITTCNELTAVNG